MLILMSTRGACAPFAASFASRLFPVWGVACESEMGTSCSILEPDSVNVKQFGSPSPVASSEPSPDSDSSFAASISPIPYKIDPENRSSNSPESQQIAPENCRVHRLRKLERSDSHDSAPELASSASCVSHSPSTQTVEVPKRTRHAFPSDLDSEVLKKFSDRLCLNVSTAPKSIGYGGLGRVYAAETSEGEAVAVKVVLSVEFYTRYRLTTIVPRMKSLLENAQVVQCETLVPIRGKVFFNSEDHSEDGKLDAMILVMPRLDWNVRELVYKAEMNMPRVLSMLQHVLKALVHLHSHNIMHRDVKLENILLDPQGVFKLCDYDTLRSCADLINLSFGVHAGSREFMAPEFLKAPSSGGYNGKVDIWAIGMVANVLSIQRAEYEQWCRDQADIMLAAVTNPVQPPGSSLIEELAPLRRFIDSCLNNDPTERPTAAQLLLLLYELFPDYFGEISADVREQLVKDSLESVDLAVYTARSS
eukprot:TRINITY_DN2796_c0_g1_i1.p1 TRINITY_DN2796_c0_g1~~TRINITY_DN2796_c0_g1_i1.p1  ORF type:complete len:477 (-),score=33.90 TRINITY_DN2796_c0_g1_i1:581-2011(-)